jgi:hypothetical protein
VTWVMSNIVLVCLETMLVLVQDMCTVCTEHTIGIEIVLDVLLADEAQVKARFGPFVDSATLDARLVHSLRRMTVGSKIVLQALNGTPR